MYKDVDSGNIFSKKLLSELKTILKTSSVLEPDELEFQEIGRHIAQFVLVKEAQKATPDIF